MKNTDEHDEDMLPLMASEGGHGHETDDDHLEMAQSMNRPTLTTTRQSSIAKPYSLQQRLVSFSAHTARQASNALFLKNSPRRSRFVRLLPLLTLATLCGLQLLFWIIFMPPPYIRLPPPFYFDTLQRFADAEIREGQASGWETRALNLLEQSRARRGVLAPQYPKWKAALKAGTLEDCHENDNATMETTTPRSVIPSTLFSSDRTPLPPVGWSEQWSSRGFEPVRFLNDSQADQWIAANFPSPSLNSAVGGGGGQNNIVRAWKALPRGVMRADVLRYLFLLVEGGTWADMDVEPLGHLDGWTKGVKQLGRSSSSGDSMETSEEDLQQPIRMVVGIECDPVVYRSISLRAWLELFRLLPLRRHREVQIVQWTLHSVPGHPILIDVLRRLLEANSFFDAYKIDLLRKAFSEASSRSLKKQKNLLDAANMRAGGEDGEMALQRLALAQKKVHPWTDVSMAWQYIKGAWRLGWHELSVEEWTGPPVWTDAVLSYLQAVAGVQPEDLVNIKHPLQIDDVVIAPVTWFNPPSPDRPDPAAKVAHHYRGSWKHGADIPA